MEIWRDRLCRLGITSAFAVTSWLVGECYVDSRAIAQSQIEPDETLGNERSGVVSLDAQGLPVDVIVNGARRNQNLFHSFREFNVNEGRSAYFDNPDGIENIFSRVTGGNPSAILGTLGVLGDANLFFLNPNGIVFGPNSSLDVRGSFAATTADGIQFGEQGFFSATNPELPSQLLTVDPSAFFFNQLATQPDRTITGQGFLSVPRGENLLLLGGTVNLNGSQLRALSGRVEIAAVRSGTAALNPDGSLTFPASTTRADVELRNDVFIDVALDGQGEIVVSADNLNITEQSFLLAGVFVDTESSVRQPGAIRLHATGDIQIDQSSSIANIVYTDAVGDAGDIIITTDSLLIASGGEIASDTLGEGDAGMVTITATDRVRLVGRSDIAAFPTGVLSRVSETGNGQSGNILITAPVVEVLNGARLATNTRGDGDAGDVVITASDRVRFAGNSADGEFISAVFSTVEQGGNGQGGDVIITAPILEVVDRAQLASSTRDDGNAGNIIITASDRVHFASGGAALASVEESATGQGGNIEITAPTVELLAGGQLTASAEGEGNAGNIIVFANDRVRLEGTNPDGQLPSGMFSRIEPGANGQGGDIEITTPVLEVLNGALLTASTSGRGNAGNVRITASDRVRFTNQSFASSTVEQGGNGQGGNIEIATATLEVLAGAQLIASTSGAGDAGNVIVAAGDQVRFNQSAAFSAVNETGEGQGGNIEITTPVLELLNGTQLVAGTRGNGRAGNVVIAADDRIRLQGGSTVFSTVEPGGRGRGGNIEITTPRLEILDGAQLLANTRGNGDAGNVIITSSDRVVLSGVNRNGTSSGIFTETGATAQGQGGRVEITAPMFRIANGAVLSARTSNAQRGGNILIQADRFDAINGGQIITTTLSSGQAGNITLNAGQIRLSGRDATFTQRSEDDRLSVQLANEGSGESGLFANTRPNSQGRGGRIRVNASQLILENGAGISAASDGTGQAGNIQITSQTIEATNSDIITTASTSGGDIQITADAIELRGDSDIRTNSGNNGGNITLKASSILAFDDSDILAFAETQGGNITLDTPVFFGENFQSARLDENPEAVAELDGNDRVDLNASGQVSSGTITIPDTTLIQNSLTALPENAIDSETLLANSCIVRSETEGTFIITGPEGLPQRPGTVVPVYPTGGVRPVPTEGSESSPNRPWQIGDPIVEPQGAYQLENGQWVLSRECSSELKRSR